MHVKNFGLFLGILLSVYSVEGMQLQVDRVDGSAGAEGIAVHLTAEDAEGLAGANLEIHYDADLLAVGDIETGNLSSGWILAANRRTAGGIRLSLAGQTGTRLATGSLSVLHFSILPEADPGAVAPIRLIDVRLYDETATPFDTVDLQDGALTVLAEVLPPQEEEPIDPFILEISSVTGLPGAEVSVQIDVDRTAEIAGGDLALTYDPDLLTPLSVEPTPLSSGLMLAANLSTPGRVAVSLAGATGMSEGEGAILTVRFTVAAEAVPGAETPLNLAHARLIDIRAIPLPIGPITAGQLRIATPFPDGTARIDLNPLPGNQETKEKGGIGPDMELPLQLFARDLPAIKGYTLTLEFDSEKLTFDRFEAGDFIPGLLVLPPRIRDHQVEAGGASLTGGSNSGDGFLGTLYLRTTDDFEGETTLSLIGLFLNMADGGSERIDLQIGGLLTSTGGLEGDFDLDGTIGFPDFFLFAEGFGLASGEPGYIAVYDLDRDGRVYFSDFFIFSDLYSRQQQIGN